MSKDAVLASFDGPNGATVVVRDETAIEVRDWERGVGETQSSGTGAAAAAAVSVIRGFTRRRVAVHTPAGRLDVNWNAATDLIHIKGPVAYIGSGTYHR